ncbi:MAG: hypothetical protein GX894_03600 [Clostridia bacterium]|nr:hypothetical protein [Clostridia bacterium]
MAVLTVKILDKNRNLQQTPQTEKTCRYPVLASSCTREIQGPSLINRWVGVIKKLAGEE